MEERVLKLIQEIPGCGSGW